MDINIEKPIKINGVDPQPEQRRWFKYTYKNLNLKTKFTGRILLVKDRIDNIIIDPWNPRPMEYVKVFEIHVENGNITLIKDQSGEMEKARKQSYMENLSEGEKFIFESLKNNNGILSYKAIQELCKEKVGGVRLVLKKMKEKNIIDYEGEIPSLSAEIKLKN